MGLDGDSLHDDLESAVVQAVRNVRESPDSTPNTLVRICPSEQCEPRLRQAGCIHCRVVYPFKDLRPAEEIAAQMTRMN